MLTGTPMPNHIRDLWSLWDVASDGLAGALGMLGVWKLAGALQGVLQEQAPSN